MNLFGLLQPSQKPQLPEGNSYLLVHNNAVAVTNVVEYFFSGAGNRNLMQCYQLSPKLFSANYIIVDSLEELLATQYAEEGWIFYLNVSKYHAIQLLKQGRFHECIIKATDFWDEYIHYNEEVYF